MESHVEWNGLFESIDRNGDGELSRSEFEQAISQWNIEFLHHIFDLFGIACDGVNGNNATTSLLEVFDCMDMDNSDSVSRIEFVRYLRRIELFAPVFATLFENGSTESLTRFKFVEKMRQFTQETLLEVFGIRDSDDTRFDRIFSVIDTDNSQIITKLELVSYLSDVSSWIELFDSLDVDHSGSICKSEFGHAMELRKRDPFLLHILSIMGMPNHSLPARNIHQRFMAIFSLMDADRSDTISQAEFIDFLSTKRKQLCNKPNSTVSQALSAPMMEFDHVIDNAFDWIDESHIGVVLKSVVMSKFCDHPSLVLHLELRDLKRPQLMGYLNRLKADSKGMVSYGEFRKFFENHFREIAKKKAPQSAPPSQSLPSPAPPLPPPGPIHSTISHLPQSLPTPPASVASSSTSTAAAAAAATSTSTSSFGYLSRLISSFLPNTNAVAKTSEQIRHKKLQDIFRKIDLDGNGQLTKTEISRVVRKDAMIAHYLGLPREVYAQGHAMNDRELENLFSIMDTDNSNEISMEEFVNYFSSPE